MMANIGLQGLQILWLALVTLVTVSSPTQYQYPSGSLACKTYNKTKLDCSNRDLVQIPMLDQNVTTSLDLSVNHLVDIIGAPFELLQNLLRLDLHSNEISQLSVAAFRGLHSLRYLILKYNKLFDLPKDVFTDLSNLIYLSLDRNQFTAIPSQAVSLLQSLQVLLYANFDLDYEHSEIDLSGFQNLSNLKRMALWVDSLQTDITADTFQQLSHSPLQELYFVWGWKIQKYTIDDETFAPLANLTELTIRIDAFPALESLHSQLYSLYLYPTFPFSDMVVVNVTTLQVLQKWNASLTHLVLYFATLQQIDDYSFVWTPNLISLDLSENEINHLTKHAFYGLKSLQKLLLNENHLSEVPSEALEVFRKYATLQYLDLSSNRITNIPQDAFSAVSSSLIYLNVETQYSRTRTYVEWINLFQTLNHISLKGGYGYITVRVDTPLRSLEHFQIDEVRNLYFTPPLCSVFPALKTAIIHALIRRFLSDLALHKCSHLYHLDLSGSLGNIASLDLDKLSINISTLNTLKMARNQMTSIKQVIFLKAPMLETLNLSYNSNQIN